MLDNRVGRRASPPGPRLPSPAQTLLLGVVTIPFLEHCHRRYGDMFSLSVLGLGPSVWITDPAAIKDLYLRDRDNLIAPGSEAALEPMFGVRSVFLADGAAHRRKRALLMPPFRGDRLAAWRDRIVEAAEHEVDAWPVGHEFALAPRMSAVTEKVIFDVVFGLGEGELQRPLREALAEMVDAGMRTAGVLLGFFPPTSALRWTPLTPWGRLQRKIDGTRALLREEIRRRRTESDLADRVDVCSLLVQATDEAGQTMSDDELADELMSLLLAGAESSATTLAWAVDFLLHHPTTLDRFRSELERSDESYIDAVLQETMRLRPVPHMTARRLASPMDVCGYQLPAGTTVTIPAYLVHHRPDLYRDPKHFKPERFLDQPPGAFTWVPFGGGARRCVGASFAMLEMRCVLSTVLRRVALRPGRDKPEKIRMRNIILAPAHRTKVVVAEAL